MSGKASSYNLALIAAYRKHPMLYDNRHRDYKVQNPTKEAWINVSTICSSTPDECRSRWKALRDRFIKERKKRNSNSNYKVAWPLYNKMSFLEPFIENTFMRNKKELRSGLARLAQNGDASRKTIDNVVELLVREASTSMIRSRSINDLNGEISMVSVVRPLEMMDHQSIPEDTSSNELEQFYLKLIREVKKHQLLFDASSSLYRVASARNRVWDEIALAFESFGEGYSAHELRTKWRSIRDRYIRERRLYKESLQEGAPKFPKWPLYPEFAFLDFYVDQTMPRVYPTNDNNNDNESVHSAEQDEDAAMNSFSLSNDNEEADQSSPSSSSSTPSTTGPTQPNISVLQLLQRIMNQNNLTNDSNGTTLFNNHQVGNSTGDTNSIILKNLSVLMQNPNFRLRNNASNPPSISSVSDGITEVLGELKTCVNKLANLSDEINEHGLEHSFGQYVTNELIRTPEPKRSELRRAILTLLNENKFKANVSTN